jgi:hypothetical protein
MAACTWRGICPNRRAAASWTHGQDRDGIEKSAQQRHVIVIDKAVKVKVAERPMGSDHTRCVRGADNRHVIVVDHAVKVCVARARVGEDDRSVIDRLTAECRIRAKR